MRRASSTLRDRARSLRKTMTVSEQRLWNWLRNRSFSGFKFRRQFPVDRFVLDFYCPGLKLAIEADGQHHGDWGMHEHDDARTRRLAQLGIHVIRVPNVLLAGDSGIVEEQIRYWIGVRAREMGL